jgi:hypothetical protein
MLALGGVYASVAQGETAHYTVTFTCSSATFTFAGFPNANNNTVAEKVALDGVAIKREPFAFNGPTGSNTVTISVPPGFHQIKAGVSWNTNGVKGEEDIAKKGGIFCPAPHWYSNGVRIPEGEAVAVETAGTLEPVRTGKHLFGTKCKVEDKETIENPVGEGAGEDEITEISFKCTAPNQNPCPKGEEPALQAGGLPWKSHLVEHKDGTITDHLEGKAKVEVWEGRFGEEPILKETRQNGIEVKVGCVNPTNKMFTEEPFGKFAGNLSPQVGNSSLDFKDSGRLLEQRKPPKGRSQGFLALGGEDKLTGPKEDETITAKSP